MGWGAIEQLSALFAPGMRHEQQRRREVEELTDDEGHGAPGGRIDLLSGVVTFHRPAQPEPSDADPIADPETDPDGGTTPDPGPVSGS